MLTPGHFTSCMPHLPSLSMKNAHALNTLSLSSSLDLHLDLVVSSSSKPIIIELSRGQHTIIIFWKETRRIRQGKYQGVGDVPYYDTGDIHKINANLILKSHKGYLIYTSVVPSSWLPVTALPLHSSIPEPSGDHEPPQQTWTTVLVHA